MRFDGVDLDELRVSPGRDSPRPWPARPPTLRAALRGRPRRRSAPSTAPSCRAETPPRAGRHRHPRLARPVDRAGCYVPGGPAAYPSTVLMTAMPARVAGVAEVVLCVPPGPDGPVARRHAWPPPPSPASTRSTASAAPRPSPPWPTAPRPSAPSTSSSGPATSTWPWPSGRSPATSVGVPSAFAGPSEIVVVADDVRPGRRRRHRPHRPGRARPGRPGLAHHLGAAVADAVDERRRPRWSPRRPAGPTSRPRSPRAATPSSSTVPSRRWRSPTLIAPEHLQLMTADPEALVPLVRHAGAVFCGPWAPAVGRRLRGRAVSHVLPTYGSARFAGGAPGRRLPEADPRRRRSTARRSSGSRAHVAASPRPRAWTPTPSRWPGASSSSRGQRRRPGPPAVSGAPAPNGRHRSATTSPRSRATTRRRSTSTSGSTPTSRRTRRRGVASTTCRRELAVVEWHRYPDRAAAELRRGHRRAARRRARAGLRRQRLQRGPPDRLPGLRRRRAASVLAFEPTYALHAHIARITGTDGGRGRAGRRLRRSTSTRSTRGPRRGRPGDRLPVLAQQPHRHGRPAPRRRRARSSAAAPGLVVVDEAYGQFAPWTAVRPRGRGPARSSSPARSPRRGRWRRPASAT